MLEQKNRITKKKDFDRIFKDGVGFKDGFLALKIIKGTTGASRFAFVVSQKVSKKATVRNKIRRRLREVARPLIGKIKNKVDGVFVALPGLEKKDFTETKENLERIIKKTKLF